MLKIVKKNEQKWQKVHKKCIFSKSTWKTQKLVQLWKISTGGAAAATIFFHLCVTQRIANFDPKAVLENSSNLTSRIFYYIVLKSSSNFRHRFGTACFLRFRWLWNNFSYWYILHGKKIKTKLECHQIRILNMYFFLHNLNFSRVLISEMKNKCNNLSQN